MDVGVISQGATSQAAGEANAKQSNAVVEQLRKLVPAANVATLKSLNLTPGNSTKLAFSALTKALAIPQPWNIASKTVA